MNKKHKSPPADDFDKAWQEVFAQFQPQIDLTTALFHQGVTVFFTALCAYHLQQTAIPAGGSKDLARERKRSCWA